MSQGRWQTEWARARAVWLQSGIRDDRTAAALARAGILVVQDRCLMVDYRSVARTAARAPASVPQNE